MRGDTSRQFIQTKREQAGAAASIESEPDREQLRGVLHGESYKRLAPPRNTTDRKHLQSNDLQPGQLTDEAPGTIERAARESSRITPNSTATVHASSTAISSRHHAHPAWPSPDPLSSMVC